MKSVKEPPLFRRRRLTNHPKKLKLVCSFNGAFHPRPPSGELSYVGGEARIISVDRNVGFSKLRSKISDLCPNTNRSFTLKYRLPGSGSACSGSDSDSETSPLVLIASDDDVRCMIEEYDKLELYGKSARLWVFVCSNGDCNDFVNGDLNCANGPGFGSKSPDFETRVKKFGALRCGDRSLRKMVLKQQLLAKQSALGRGCVANKNDMEMGFIGETPKCDSYERSFVDLESNCGHNVDQFSVFRSNPLNARDGNSRVETNGYRPTGVMCNGAGMSMNCCGAKSGNGCGGEAKQEVGNNGMAGISYLNRENIMPWEANSCVDSLCRNGNPGDRVWGGLNSSIRNHRLGVSDPRNQRCYPYNVRCHHRSNIAEMASHATRQGILARKCYQGLRPNVNIAKQGQPVRVHHQNSWRHYYGSSDHAMEERMRMMDSRSMKGSYLINALYGNRKPSKRSGPVLSQRGNFNPNESYLGYCGSFTGVADQPLLFSDANEIASPSQKTMDTPEDLLTGSDSGKCEGPYQTSYASFHGMPGIFESLHCELEKGTHLMDSQKVSNTCGLPSEVGYITGVKLGGDNMSPNGETVVNAANISINGTDDVPSACNGVTSSLHNLSLSSSKEVEASLLSSHASGVVSSGIVLKPQPKNIDLMDEEKFTRGHPVDQSNGVLSNCSSQNSAKKDKGSAHDEEVHQDLPSIDRKANNRGSFECSKAVGGTSSDLAAFYTHLATRELQTIKNSDLEFIKELGSGTYGTVYHGKWKGSDVAVKKIKPSCFAEDTVKEDRLLADFWKEAHMLAQLHHPNIVAFYGVVSDGPLSDLATVTEYMVNGSLKQVLRRKDRTIDRRKRLIIAMDAAFGMEYLHEKSIVHFDLKSHNFLVNMRDPQRPVCKIGDLGLSKIKQRTLISGGVRGTIPWMAPELLTSKNNLVTEKVDVYSFGIVMWELLTGEEPYANLRSEEIIAGIIKGNIRPEIPSWCDPMWRSLMERCWSSDPDFRPPFSEIAQELRSMSATMNIK